MGTVVLASQNTSTMHAPEQRAGLRILVVEDCDDCAVTMAMLLRFFGHDVQIARNGTEALEAVSADKPDVVLLDIGLPGMNGYEVARRLRETRTIKTPWIIAVTGYGQAADRQRSAEVGIDLHLLKPIDVHRLEAILRGFQTLIDWTAGAEESVQAGT
jgi:CheY-like chemotaxis protein